MFVIMNAAFSGGVQLLALSPYDDVRDTPARPPPGA
jgi:hypothetical protein